MAGRKENIKALFSSTRSRVIIIFTFVLLLLAVAIGVSKFYSKTGMGAQATADVPYAPSIQSIPGAIDPTAQYAKLQEAQNTRQAEQALKTGTSAIPTIVRSQAIGDGVQGIGAETGTGGLGFTGLEQQQNLGSQHDEWLNELKKSNCSKSVLDNILNLGASLASLKGGCSCVQLKQNGYTLQQLQPVCNCPELKGAGFTAEQLKQLNYTAEQLRICGFDACQLRNAGFTAQQMKDGGFSDGELKGAGYPDADIDKAGGLPPGVTAADVLKADCNVAALEQERNAGVSAAAIRRIAGCSAAQLKAAGYSAADLRRAGFTAAELKNAGFTPQELAAAGYSPNELQQIGVAPTGLAVGQAFNCSVESLTAARAAGISATTIRQKLGCSAAAMKAAGYTAADLKAAGFTAAELKNAGFTPEQLKAAGFDAKQLRDAGVSAAELRNLGFTADQLKGAGFNAAQLATAGFSPSDLKDAGFTAAELKNAGLSASDLKNAGFSTGDLQNAGFTNAQLADAGLLSSQVTGLTPPTGQNSLVSAMPSAPGVSPDSASSEAKNTQQLQDILKRQGQQMADQRYQQRIQQRASQMMSSANESIQNWSRIATQVYAAGAKTDAEKAAEAAGVSGASTTTTSTTSISSTSSAANQQALVKTGDVLFAVIDTSVNSDEPSPILATIVSEKFKGAKLIGSFTLPNNADKMIISFNTLSVPGAAKTTSINAYAIDANTARTALSSNTDHHYLLRYGSLFAATFLEGFGNAFQSANTTVTIGGTGGGDNITVQQGIDRSILENAIVGLATLGKAWGQVAQQQFNRPTTVEVYSGTGIGVLFTQDVTSL